MRGILHNLCACEDVITAHCTPSSWATEEESPSQGSHQTQSRSVRVLSLWLVYSWLCDRSLTLLLSCHIECAGLVFSQAVSSSVKVSCYVWSERCVRIPTLRSNLGSVLCRGSGNTCSVFVSAWEEHSLVLCTPVLMCERAIFIQYFM